MPIKQNNPSREVAVIGMAGIFPKAPDVSTFWQNILGLVDAVGDPLPEWEPERHLETERIATAKGGFLKELYQFDPKGFGIMPNSLDGGEPDQYLALQVARDALMDTGPDYLDRGYDHSGTGIVLGHSTYLHRGQGNILQHNLFLDQTLEILGTVFEDLDKKKKEKLRELLEKKLPGVNSDIVPGLVPNVMTGRIANRLNFKGPNYLIDAACASSLLAVDAAIDELYRGHSRLMLAGGVNASLPPEVSVIFTHLGALSRTGRIRPFSKGGDGTLLGEGLGMVVLKKLEDAVGDKDRIYAVIKGIGKASDGREQSLLAPNAEGEALSIKRAYHQSGIDPMTVGLIEAHGTGIPLGDKTEIQALKTVFGSRCSARGSIALGSVKSMISHCIPAAGIAGLIKTVMALHHKILPPTICHEVNPELGIEKTPFYLNTSPRPWISPPGHKRRAGISCFGFGGINAHAIVEEAPDTLPVPDDFSQRPAELCVFSAKDCEGLKTLLNKGLALSKKGIPIAGMARDFLSRDSGGAFRLAVVAKNGEDLGKKIKQAIKRLDTKQRVRWSTRNGMVFSSSPIQGKLAFMFPGEGSQYLDMFSDLALYFNEVRTWFDFWKGLYEAAPGESRTDILFPAISELTSESRKDLESRLHDMDVGSEAVFIGGQAMNELLISFGINPDVMVGHSSGESSALAASGAIHLETRTDLTEFIRELNAVYNRVLAEGKIATGALLAVGALPKQDIKKVLSTRAPTIVVAMDNCDNQVVLFGDKEEMAELNRVLVKAGAITMPLPFDRGYHTPQFEEMSRAFLDYYNRIGLKSPKVPLYSCDSAELFPDDRKKVRALAASQWSRTVRFTDTIRRMYEDGVRVFIEVGPSGNLSAFLNDILSGKESVCLATNLRQKNGVEQFLSVLSHLWVNDRAPDLDRLFSGRMIPVPKEINQGMFLCNTMPVIHLDDEEKALFKKVLGSAEAKTGHCQKTSPYAAPEPVQDQKAAGAMIAMNSHFDLMNQFLDQQERIWNTWHLGGDPKNNDSGPARNLLPFSGVVVQQDAGQVTLECRLDLHENNFLKDHVLSGTVSSVDPDLRGLSCIPLAVSLEIMAQAGTLAAGTRKVRAIENLKALGWIALDDEYVELTVTARPVREQGNACCHTAIFNGDKLVVEADFLFETEQNLEGLPMLLERRPSGWEEGEPYRIGMFHGPMFQSIRQVEAWSPEGIDAILAPKRLEGFFNDRECPDLITNPVLLDVAGQIAAFWISLQVGTDFNCFPSTIGRIELYQRCPKSIDGFKIMARQQAVRKKDEQIEALRDWAFECIDREGNTVFRIKNWVNVYFPVPNRFYRVRHDPLNGWLGHPTFPDNPDTLVWHLPWLEQAFLGQSDRIFMRILAHILLADEERQAWLSLDKSVGRLREWLLGRACIKEAVRYWIHQHTGELLYPSDVVVLHDAYGAPFTDGWWNGSLTEAPEISLSHDKKGALAAVSGPGRPVGVDREQLGRIKTAESLGFALTPKEQSLLNGFTGAQLEDRLLRIWCAKEAACKYMGTGFEGRPQAIEVDFNSKDWDRAQAKFSGVRIEIILASEEESIVALATGPLG